LISRPNRIQATAPVRPVVYGIGIYFLCSAADSFQISGIGSLLKLVALLPLGLALLDIKRWKLRISPTFTAQLLFWLLAVVSVLYSVNTDKSFSSIMPLTLNLALVFCLGILEGYNARELQLMQRAMLAGSWITIAMMLLFSDVSADGRLTLLLGGKTQDQNYINGYFLYAFSWHCSQLLLHRKKRHFLPAFFILCIVLLTGSRGALIAFLLVIFVHICLFFANFRHKVRNILLAAIFMVLLLVLFDMVLAQMPKAVAQRYSWDYIAEKGTTGRTRIWRFFLEHYFGDSMGRMLFGHGYGTSMLVNTMDGKVAHNLYLDNLITLGIPGLLLQLIIQGTVLGILLRHREYPLLGAYCGMLAMCLSLSLVAYKPIWNIMLLALAINGSDKSKSHLPALFALVKRHSRAILAAGMIGGVITYCVCSFLVPPVYEANAKMIVSSHQKLSGYLSADQFNSSEDLTDTYAVILRSRPVLESVIENLNLSTDVETLAKKVHVTSVNGTAVMKIAVRSKDPDLALKIVEQIIHVCPGIIHEIVEAGSVKTVEAAYLKQTPVAPNTNLSTLLAALLSMASVFIAALIRILRDNTYKTDDDLRNDLALPVLGVIPDYQGRAKQKDLSKESEQHEKGIRKNRQHSPMDTGSVPFAYAEAYKTLCTNLSFVSASRHCKKIIITSAISNEGKSTVAVNLAAALAESGARVLLIDCDLRNPTPERLLLQTDSRKGLTSLLTGMQDAADCIVRHPKLNFDILPAGVIPPNPVELLSSQRMNTLLNRMNRYYDYIICDTPPVNAVTDTAALSRFCDGVILVVRQKLSTRTQAQAARQKLEAVQANILGTILSCRENSGDIPESHLHRRFRHR